MKLHLKLLRSGGKVGEVNRREEPDRVQISDSSESSYIWNQNVAEGFLDAVVSQMRRFCPVIINVSDLFSRCISCLFPLRVFQNINATQVIMHADVCSGHSNSIA